MNKDVDQIVDTWFQELISNTVVQRDDILYNKFYKAKEELKKSLTGKPVESKTTINKESK